ncbi:hypothetical protein PsYK624_056950 [Phanerochaete sordida]|uniref:Uncharacterized protein n=1 Tax=Phanerochaete sordida TaxID=48140 RepID=A0A9P3LBL1_9APHY|nr:hypothetical protein PsYK624_056950 [Phanerochaete sordida]
MDRIPTSVPHRRTLPQDAPGPLGLIRDLMVARTSADGALRAEGEARFSASRLARRRGGRV